MKYFQMRQPRKFNHRMIYAHDTDFHIQRQQPAKGKSSMGIVTMLVLLLLILLLWYSLG